MNVPTAEDIENYLESLEEFVASSLSQVTPHLPNVREAAHRLWLDISRYGPAGLGASFKDMHIPGLGEFEVPPPPPPPPPKSWVERTADWAGQNPWKASGITIGVVGVGLFAGYTAVQARYAHVRRLKALAANHNRRAVVVLGGDSPLALALILDLERKGYIVVASVATAQAAEELEHQCHGYVRALVLDPTDADSVPTFLRSLASALSRRFPLNAHGDPYASPASHPYIHSVISLLTLPPPSVQLQPAPLEHLALHDSYLPYLQGTHIAPLQVLQGIMPMLRTTPARSRDSYSNSLAKRSIIVCIPATDTLVGLPFASAQAMSATATLRGIEILRREIRVAALTDKSDSLRNIKVVTVDVGAFGPAEAETLEPQDVYKAMGDWTNSEKLAYGGAFASILQSGYQHGMHRRPTDIATVVDTIVDVVSGGRQGKWLLLGIGHGLGRLRNWFRGERIAIGAGARTYALASFLPASILDILINVSYLLASVRNGLSTVKPRVAQPYPPPLPPAAPAIAPGTESLPASDHEHSETGSEADVESNSGYGSGVESSWVRTSLWLVPTAEQTSKLERVLHAHPPRKPDSSSYPHFHSHITLITIPTSPAALQALREAIPTSQPRIAVNFESVEVGDAYFRSVFVACTHSTELVTLNESIRAALKESLGLELGPGPRFPHMSLYYIDDAEAQERRRRYEQLVSDGKILRDSQGIALDCRVGSEKAGPTNQLGGFDGHEVWIAECEGPVEEWKVLAKIPLH
ncbi:hypothetical protein PLICRDRAFT_175346 [Plicaturopsis crispa FD-325 SS-3]|nr:hypothetical protein PLICRDRAFT_175346 [Plicaturopsis crispa FD-325 SS-3]